MMNRPPSPRPADHLETRDSLDAPVALALSQLDDVSAGNVAPASITPTDLKVATAAAVNVAGAVKDFCKPPIIVGFIDPNVLKDRTPLS